MQENSRALIYLGHLFFCNCDTIYFCVLGNSRALIPNNMSNQSEFLFWHVPQLLNGLVEVLDMASLLEVSLVVPLAADLGGGTVVFKRLLTKAAIGPLPRDLRHDTRKQTEEDSVELISRLQPLITLINRMSSPSNALKILTDHISQKFQATDLQYKAIVVNSMADNRESSVSPLGFFLLDWVNRMASTDEPIFKISAVHVTNLSSNILVALAEKANLDRLPPESFSAHSVTTESNMEAASLLKLANFLNPLQIRSVGIFQGTTAAAWRMILEAFIKMGTLEDDSAEKRGFQVPRFSKKYYELKLPISSYCWYWEIP